MSTTDKARRDLFVAWEAHIGTDNATTAMELLPRQPTHELVTRSDMHAFGTELRGEMAELRVELKSEMAELRAELKNDMAELRSEVRQEITRLDASITDLRGRTDRVMLGGVVATVLAVFAAAGLA